jgi:hypothetical protein
MVKIELFAARMNLRASQVRSYANRAVKAGATAVVHRVTEETPADTGQARSNWITTLDTPFFGTVPPYAPGSKLGMGETANAQGAQLQAKPAISAYQVDKNAAVIVQNNLDYIKGLDDGTISAQSRNMVAKAVQSGVIAVRAVKAFL